MFKVNNKNSRTTSVASIWCSYCWFWTHFTAFSSASIVNFEQVNVMWNAITVMITLKHPVSGYWEFRRVPQWKFGPQNQSPVKSFGVFTYPLILQNYVHRREYTESLIVTSEFLNFTQMSFNIITPVILLMPSRY